MWAINKYKLDGNRRIDAVIRHVESEKAGCGRVLVRRSGTEARVRVMAEGPDERELSGYDEGIVEVVKEELEYSVV
ncbi:hypothetical protein [Paenibacillus foliorum]|uniref:hypothetical protein n=1 Tax=Paenibacillus foliorum TaxID=2654974 RepID=UPI001490B468|nr:hypothetical protein [Paenibacillus foliorum]